MHGTDVPELPAQRSFTIQEAGLCIMLSLGVDSTLLTVTGELDYATRCVFDEAIEHALRVGTPILILDLGGLEFLAVVGAHAFEQAAKRCGERGGRLVLLNPVRRVRRLLGLFGIAALIGDQD